MWFNLHKCIPEPSPNSHCNWVKPQKIGTKIIPLFTTQNSLLIMNFDKYTKEYDKKILQNMKYIYVYTYTYIFFTY